MANSIVFQNSAEQLKASIYGFDGTDYKAIKVTSNGELSIIVGTVSVIGTLNTISSITNGTIKASISSLTSGTVKVSSLTSGTLSSITNGTVKVASLTNGTIKLASTSATVKVNLVDRTFTSTTQTIRIDALSATFSNLIDISKYQETSWYIRNITKSSIITVQLAVTPSSARSTYPFALIQETATLKNNTTAITNSYYMKYATAKISNVLGLAQTIVVVFNGRY